MCVRVYARVHRFYVLSRNRLTSKGGLPESSARPAMGRGEIYPSKKSKFFSPSKMGRLLKYYVPLPGVEQQHNKIYNWKGDNIRPRYPPVPERTNQPVSQLTLC